MGKQPRASREEDRVPFYMDIVSHDILNNNQAVLSYLELILATPGTDKKVKDFAEKAVAHVRTSTILVDNIKRVIASRSLDPEKLRPIDLVKAIDLGESQLKKHFPAKSIRIHKTGLPRSAFVLGDLHAADLVLNVFVTAIRLSPGDDITMSASMSESEFKGKPAWTISVEDKTAELPPFLDGEGVAATYSQDISTAVKSTGIIYAKMIAANLGGDFEVHAVHHDPKKKGAVFTLILRKVEKP